MNEKIECRASAIGACDYLAPEYLRELQLTRLKKIVRHAYDNVEFFRNRMNEAGLTPDVITSLKDLGKLPFRSFCRTSL